MQAETKRSYAIARFIIGVTNPAILSPLLLLGLFITEAKSTAVLLNGTITLFLLLILIPLIYISLRMRFTHRKCDPTVYLKRHPGDILVLEIICGAPCWLILTYLKAPTLSTRTLAVLLVTALIIAIIYLFYRASFHLAALTVIVCTVVLAWGPLYLFLVLSIPAIAWAKYHLREHTPFQMLLGTALGTIIVFFANYYF